MCLLAEQHVRRGSRNVGSRGRTCVRRQRSASSARAEIGQTLYESIRSFRYAETAVQVIIVVTTVMAIDLLSARLRKALV